MEVDTGSAVSVISEMLYKKLFHSVAITKSSKKLVAVNRSRLSVSGQFLVKASLNGRNSLEKLVVLNTDSDFTTLLGRNWMESCIRNGDRFSRARDSLTIWILKKFAEMQSDSRLILPSSQSN